jgi:hypothetical protein
MTAARIGSIIIAPPVAPQNLSAGFPIPHQGGESGARGQRYERALQYRRYQDDLLWERHNESAIKSFEIFRIVPKSRRSVLV